MSMKATFLSLFGACAISLMAGEALAASAPAMALAETAMPTDAFVEIYTKTCPARMFGELISTDYGKQLSAEHPSALDAGVAAACATSEKLRFQELPSYKDDLAQFYDAHFSQAELSALISYFHIPFWVSMTQFMHNQVEHTDYSTLLTHARQTGKFDPADFQKLLTANTQAVHAYSAKMITPEIADKINRFAESSAGKKWAALGPDTMTLMQKWLGSIQQQNASAVSQSLQSAISSSIQSESSKP